MCALRRPYAQAAHLVLLDDAFPSIVKACRMGRRIYDNLRKVASLSQ